MGEIMDRPYTAELRDVQRREAAVPRKLEIDLGIVATDQEYSISGNIFYIWESEDSAAEIQVKFNRNTEAAIPLSQQTGLLTPFDTVYITTPAGQTGTMTILYGTESPELLDFIDNRSQTSADLAAIRNQLEGDAAEESFAEITVGAAAVQLLAANAGRKACWIHNDINNSDDLYLGFDNTVTTAAGGNIWFAVLSPGMGWGVDDYRGDIYGICAGAGNAVGVGEW